MSVEPIFPRWLLVDENGAPCPRDEAHIHTKCSKCGRVVERSVVMANRPIACRTCKDKRRVDYNKTRYDKHKAEPVCSQQNCKIHKRGRYKELVAKV